MRWERGSSIGRRTDGRNGGDDLAELQLVQNRGFTGGIETDHQNSHLLLPPQPVEQLADAETHLGGLCKLSLRMCIDAVLRSPSFCKGRILRM